MKSFEFESGLLSANLWRGKIGKNAFFQSSNFQLLDLTGRDICCWSFSFNGLFYPSWSHPWFESEPTKTLIFVWLQTRVSKHLKLDKRWSLVGWSLSVFWSVQTYRPKPPWPNSAPMKPPPRPPMAAPGVPMKINCPINLEEAYYI